MKKKPASNTIFGASIFSKEEKMKKTLMTLALTLLVSSVWAQGAASINSVGLTVGEDTGLNLRSSLEGRRFLQLTFAGFDDEKDIVLTHNWLFRPYRKLTPYIGAGFAFEIDDDNEVVKNDNDDLALRVPVGATLNFGRDDLLAYAEIINEIDEDDYDLGLGIGLNYAF